MGLALTNPNDHRRVNAATRAVMKGKLTVEDAAAMILAGKTRREIQKASGLYLGTDTPRGAPAKAATGKAHTPARQAAMAAMMSAPAQDKGRKTQYNKVRRQLVAALSADEKYGRGYPTRFSKSAAGRYISKSKKVTRSTSPKGKAYQGWVKGGGRGKVTQVVLNIPAVTAADAIRVKNREASGLPKEKWRQMPRAKDAPKGTGTGIRGNILTRGGKKDATDKSTRGRKASAGRRALTPGQLRAGFGGKAAQEMYNRLEIQTGAVANPNIFGGLALTNPMMDYQSLAIKGGVALAAAGAGVYVHSKVVPVVSEYYEKIPVVGEYLVEYDYAATGLLAGIALGGVAAYIGGDAGMYLGLLAGGVAAAGGALQVAEMVGIFDGSKGGLVADEELESVAADDLSGIFGGIALDNGFGGIALDNQGVFGGIALDNYGDGMAYELGGFSSPFDEAASAYGSAELADAQHAGADLDVAEGEAACAGPQEWLNRFGHPPHRVNVMGGSQSAASHLAGHRGHRWGWLIKMIGFRKFQRLAALPPQQRLALINKMRHAAIQTMQNEMQASMPPMSPEFVSGQTAGAAPAMAGADTSYGGMLFAGESSM